MAVPSASLPVTFEYLRSSDARPKPQATPIAVKTAETPLVTTPSDKHDKRVDKESNIDLFMDNSITMPVAEISEAITPSNER